MTLLAPAFLIGLLAIGLPIWLHRLSSDNPNRQPFSSLMFLEPGEPQRVLAKQLQYLLLLALRIGILVLVALAFAGPALQRSAPAAAGQSAALHVIVLDTSLSMAHGGRWDRARDEARAVLGGLDPADLTQLLAAGRLTEVLVDASLDRGAITRAMNALEPGVFRVDYGELMDALDGLLRGVELPVVLHLVTDTQATALPTRFADLASQGPLELRVRSVAATGDENWAVDGLVYAPGSGEVAASVRGFGTGFARKRLVLELNGDEIAEQALEVSADGSAQAVFQPFELAAGSNRVRVRLEPGDDLEADDERFLVINRPVPRPVLMISNDPRGRDALFLTAAMETLASQPFHVERETPAGTADHSLDEYAFIVVADAGSLGEREEAERLEAYVEAGGSVFMALGQRAMGLDQVPLSRHQFESFGQFGGSRAGGFTGIGAMDRSHPALQAADELRSAKFFRYAALDPTPDDRVLIRLEDGSPLLIEHNLGAGRVLLFTSSLDREWNDLPVQPVFVPFVAELGAYLAGGAGLTTEARLGSALTPRALGIQGGQIFDPRGDRVSSLAGSGDEILLDQIGFYEIVSGGETELVAVNTDPMESDTSSMDSARLERWQGLGTERAEQAPITAGTDVADAPPIPLWPWLIALLVIVVVMESWVANWHLKVRRGIAT